MGESSWEDAWDADWPSHSARGERGESRAERLAWCTRVGGQRLSEVRALAGTRARAGGGYSTMGRLRASGVV